MSVRELLNEHRTTVSVIAVVMIVGLLTYVFWQSKPRGETFANQAYYTDDDGQSYFADNAAKVVPFSHGGKEAVRAYVYNCSGTKSVHYMERYTAIGQKAAAEALARSGGKEVSLPESLMLTGLEFKRPGESTWHPKPPGPKPCPDGSQPQWVTP